MSLATIERPSVSFTAAPARTAQGPASPVAAAPVTAAPRPVGLAPAAPAVAPAAPAATPAAAAPAAPAAPAFTRLVPPTPHMPIVHKKKSAYNPQVIRKLLGGSNPLPFS